MKLKYFVTCNGKTTEHDVKAEAIKQVKDLLITEDRVLITKK